MCKCFSRNNARMNDLNGVANLLSVWHKSFISWLMNVKNIFSSEMEISKLKWEVLHRKICCVQNKNSCVDSIFKPLLPD